MARKSSSLIIFGSLFVIICLQFFPRCLAARNLEEVPEPPGGNSKANVDPSQPKHDGSANDDNVPTNGGVVQTPPTSFHKSDSRTESRGSQTVTNKKNGVVSTKTWNDTERVMDWNGHQFETKNSSVNVTSNGNGGGEVVYSPPITAYQPPEGPENSQFHFPPFPPFRPFNSP